MRFGLGYYLYVFLTLFQQIYSYQSQEQHHFSDVPSFIDQSIFRKSALSRTELFASSPPPQKGPVLHSYDDSVDPPEFEGIAYFAHLNTTDCFSSVGDEQFDIAVVGAPFDLGVTYRPGARFGPVGARMASQRLGASMGYSFGKNTTNPFKDWATVVDCGDIINDPFDKLAAVQELELGWRAIASRKVKNSEKGNVPRIVSIGGDHTISLPAIRALTKTFPRVLVLHFDSHLDSWDPTQVGGGKTKYSQIHHGSMFHILHEEGLLLPKGNMHLGIRTKLFDKTYDVENDERCGFESITAREIDEIGVNGIVEHVVEVVGDEMVYVSIDIDVLDPAFAPATGTIEPGGWTTRELLRILAGLSKAGINIVGADVVEFSPIYDNAAETSGLVVGELVYELLQWMVKVPVHAASK